MSAEPESQSWKKRLYTIIFEHHTPGGRAFDVALFVLIVFSVIVVLLDSVESIRSQYKSLLFASEWAVTILFTIEYLLRIYCARKRLGYLVSFFGIIDLLTVLPAYVDFLMGSGAHYLMIVRVLRLLRIFRVFKLSRYLSQATVLSRALRASREKITVFLGVVLTLVILIGAIMYLVEGPSHGFTSIPRSIYWAIVTLTTVGYGDIAPATTLGQLIACVVMIVGYGIIAVPTGIVSVELHRASGVQRLCTSCKMSGHDQDARFCKGCGAGL